MLAAVGVVYGDIGTSPLYALQVCFNPQHGIVLNEANVLGILSLLFWALTIVVSLKYIVFVMSASNEGEGGILALLAMALRGTRQGSRIRWLIISCGIAGAAMFYGDAIITPAISVLSAIEGLKVAAPGLGHFVSPLTIIILAALFLIQSYGTARVGNLFGPITLLWFFVIGGIGLVHVLGNPMVLHAINPMYGLRLLAAGPAAGFVLLGSVFLAVTGAEALYADMGHFGSSPIRVDWFGLVMPALLLNYFGQGALVLAHPEAIKNPFYLMVPDWAIIPLVVLATCATVIASQAVISGAFSLTSQAVKLGYAPRLETDHTSNKRFGQIYMPFVNWLLFFLVVLLVVGFKTSSALASAYGIAVSGTMVVTTLLLLIVARRLWHWNLAVVVVVIGTLLSVDVVFLAANATKILDGGWFPLVVGVVCYVIFMTWKRGRVILFERLAEQGIPLRPFIENLLANPPLRVPGNAVFMTSTIDSVPHALLHNLKHNKVLHERSIFLKIMTRDVPTVSEDERLRYEKLAAGFYVLEANYGFKDVPNILEVLESCRLRYGLGCEMMATSFFLSRETIIPSQLPGMALWRDYLFAWMSRNATRATDYFQLPANRVIELGTHVEI
jgi:KUP system potassium uptake protein